MQLAVGVLFADDQKWHRIGGVCGERRAVLLIHPVGVAMVGGQQNGAVHRQDLFHHLAYAAVHRLYRLNCRIEYTGVSDHVAVSKVEDDNVVFSAVQTGKQLVGHLIGAHLRLQIVGGNLRGVDECAVLPF